MKRMVSNEKGYTLFLALLIVLLFAVTATSLLTVTVGGTSKTTIRDEQVKSQELAEKGAAHLVQQINTELKSFLEGKVDGSTDWEFEQKLEDVIATYTCKPDDSSSVRNFEPKTGDYAACVSNTSEVEDNKTMRLIEIKSKGIVNGEPDREVTTSVKVGALAEEDYLKYAVSSFQKENGEGGNMYLHGGITIKGDLKVDGNIITADGAFTPVRSTLAGQEYLIKENYWVESVLPSIEPFNGSRSNILLGGEIYKYRVPYDENGGWFQDSNRENKYKSHINRTDFSGSEYIKVTDTKDAFLNAPEYVKREPIRKEIPISGEISNFAYHYNDQGVEQINSASFQLFEGHRTFKNLNYPNKSLYGFYCAEGLLFDCFLNLQRTYNGKFYLVGNNNNLGKFAVQQDLHIGRELLDLFNEGISVTFNDGLYVGRHLIIGRGITSNFESSLSEPTLNVKIDGNMYVNGNLKITGAVADLNSVIYVNGDVTIDHSKLVNSNQNRSLVIFAKGKINFIKNSLFKGDASQIEGFFYSQEGIEIYGSASNLTIKGGLSAPKIVLNSIRGRANLGGPLGIISPFSPNQHYGFEYYEPASSQQGKASRLQIIYDPKIIENHSDIISHARVYEVLPPEVIDRKVSKSN